ncbi:hepatocyte growth factor-like [Styela clava]
MYMMVAKITYVLTGLFLLIGQKATTAAKTTTHTMTAVHENITSLTQKTIFAHSTNTKKGKESECFTKEDKGGSYRGKITVTKSGIECQRWNEQHPHEHTRTAEVYLFAGLDANFCRNPDGEDGPWCYTTDEEERWQYCNVSECSSTTTAAKTTTHQTTAVHENITSLT